MSTGVTAPPAATAAVRASIKDTSMLTLKMQQNIEVSRFTISKINTLSEAHFMHSNLGINHSEGRVKLLLKSMVLISSAIQSLLIAKVYIK